MILTITLPGSIRSKKNSKRIYARGNFKKVLPSLAYLAWEREARIAIRTQIPAQPIPYPIWIKASIYYKGARPDLSGTFESIGDCLEGHLYLNDRQIYSWDGSRLHHDKDNPRTELTIQWEET